MAAAIALGERGRGLTAPNPNVGCVIVQADRVVGEGWTQPGGRPHAEAVALSAAGDAVRGATVYTTLEPCAHVSARGPACALLLAEARPAKVVIGVDPHKRMNSCSLGGQRHEMRTALTAKLRGYLDRPARDVPPSRRADPVRVRG